LSGRLASVDAYRGLAILLSMAKVLEFWRVHEARPERALWRFLAYHQTHVAWVGCSLNDLIQPSFSFLLGAAMALARARRPDAPSSAWQRAFQVLRRALTLILLGVFLRSQGAAHTRWAFTDTLSQLGLGYGFLYLLSRRSARAQGAALAAILVGYWLLFALYPLPSADFDWARAGTSQAQMLPGFAAHWSLNTNAAWAFDTWFLNLFPGRGDFSTTSGGYTTLSFLPTLGTMILGLLAGGVLTGDRTPRGKATWLAIAGFAGLGAGWLVDAIGLCPIVKRIWTPSWVLFSGGWCLLVLAGFYLVMDVGKRRAWAFGLTVVGTNALAAYLIAHLFGDFIAAALPRHLGRAWFTFAGGAYQQVPLGAAVVLVEWLLLLWLYRRKFFLRL
jgi:predicted acyltransferase